MNDSDNYKDNMAVDICFLNESNTETGEKEDASYDRDVLMTLQAPISKTQTNNT